MSAAVLSERISGVTSTGRTVGVLVLAHLVAAMFLPFVMLDIVRGSEGLLVNAANHAGTVRAAVLIFFAGTAMAIAVSISAYPVISRHSPATARWLFAIAVAAFTLQTVDNGALMSLLSLSQEYVKAGTTKPEVFETVALIANAMRKWAHFTYLLVAVSWMALLYIALLRCALVPRALAIVGLLACITQIASVSLRVIFGYPPIMELAMPLGPVHLTLAIWLMVKGFDQKSSRA
jgi:hypothetical protein